MKQHLINYVEDTPFVQNESFDRMLEIISNRVDNPITRKEAYVEKHHIFPRSFGGGDEPENLVNLLPEEHYDVHLLLTRCTRGTARDKMCYAFDGWFSKKNGNIELTRDEYAEIKRNTRAYRNVTAHTEESRRKRSASMKLNRKNNPEVWERRDNNYRKTMEDPLKKEKRKNIFNNWRRENPEGDRARQDKANLKTRLPESRKANSARTLQWIKDNPEKQQKKLDAVMNALGVRVEVKFMDGRVEQFRSMGTVPGIPGHIIVNCNRGNRGSLKYGVESVTRLS